MLLPSLIQVTESISGAVVPLAMFVKHFNLNISAPDRSQWQPSCYSPVPIEEKHILQVFWRKQNKTFVQMHFVWFVWGGRGNGIGNGFLRVANWFSSQNKCQGPSLKLLFSLNKMPSFRRKGEPTSRYPILGKHKKYLSFPGWCWQCAVTTWWVQYLHVLILIFPFVI